MSSPFDHLVDTDALAPLACALAGAWTDDMQHWKELVFTDAIKVLLWGHDLQMAFIQDLLQDPHLYRMVGFGQPPAGCNHWRGMYCTRCTRIQHGRKQQD